MAHSSLRFGLGRFTTEAEVDFVVQHIVGTVHRLREMRFVVSLLGSDRLTYLFIAHCGRWSKKGSISIRLTGRNLNTEH